MAVNVPSFKHILRNTAYALIIDHSTLLEVYSAKFLRDKDMTISDFLSRYPGHDLASPYEIIPISFQIIELLNNENKLDNVTEALKDLG